MQTLIFSAKSTHQFQSIAHSTAKFSLNHSENFFFSPFIHRISSGYDWVSRFSSWPVSFANTLWVRWFFFSAVKMTYWRNLLAYSMKLPSGRFIFVNQVRAIYFHSFNWLLGVFAALFLLMMEMIEAINNLLMKSFSRFFSLFSRELIYTSLMRKRISSFLCDSFEIESIRIFQRSNDWMHTSNNLCHYT